MFAERQACKWALPGQGQVTGLGGLHVPVVGQRQGRGQPEPLAWSVVRTGTSPSHTLRRTELGSQASPPWRCSWSEPTQAPKDHAASLRMSSVGPKSEARGRRLPGVAVLSSQLVGSLLEGVSPGAGPGPCSQGVCWAVKCPASLRRGHVWSEPLPLPRPLRSPPPPSPVPRPPGPTRPPPLQLLDAHHEVEVALGVLLDDIPHVVGLPRLLRWERESHAAGAALAQ